MSDLLVCTDLKLTLGLDNLVTTKLNSVDQSISLLLVVQDLVRLNVSSAQSSLEYRRGLTILG